MVDKEYVSFWVPKEQAERVKKAQSEEAQYEMIEKLIESTKRDMRDDLALLDEDVLRFKGMLLAYKKAYTEVLESHRDACYKVWEDIDKTMPDMRASATAVGHQLDGVKEQIKGVFNDVKSLIDTITHVNVYQLTEMVKLVDAIERCSPETRATLQAVMGMTVNNIKIGS